MKTRLLITAILPLATTVFALDGQSGIHDPATVTLCDGKYYTYGTGGNPIVSDDGWTWRRGTAPARTGAAPDVIHIGDRYFMYISGITMISSKSLDPNSPDYKWDDGGTIAGYENQNDFLNPIDPGALLAPDGKLWLTYGSYVGPIRVVQLDPKTGKRVDNKFYNISINCEASDMIYHDGWYYLLATHGSCCAGANSGYNIRMGRSKTPTGPFLDNTGVDMIQGGGKQFMGSEERHIGPGHFGLLDLEDTSAQKFSIHWEADLDRGGASVLDIRPLLWKDGWPVAGENMKEGTYQIQSMRTGNSLELAVESVAVGGGGRGGRGGGGARGGRGGAPAAGAVADTNAAPGGFALGGTNAPGGGRGGRGGGGGGLFGGTGGGPVAAQTAASVSSNWPTDNIDLRLANFMSQAQQKWTVSAVANGGGYPGSPYFKITVAGTDRALAATDNNELVTMPAFTGGPEQLWRFDQLTDGTWRIMPKNSKGGMALSAVGNGFASLTKFNPDSDRHRWSVKIP